MGGVFRRLVKCHRLADLRAVLFLARHCRCRLSVSDTPAETERNRVNAGGQRHITSLLSTATTPRGNVPNHQQLHAEKTNTDWHLPAEELL